MSGSSSALLMVGPTGVGPFHSHDWRVGFTAQLVEGGTNGPYWLFQRSNEREQVLFIDGLDAKTVVQSIVLILAFAIGSANLKGWLDESHNTYLDEMGEIRIAPYWEVSEDLLIVCVRELHETVRLGFVMLDALSILDDEVVAHLCGLGFDVDTFGLLASEPEG